MRRKRKKDAPKKLRPVSVLKKNFRFGHNGCKAKNIDKRYEGSYNYLCCLGVMKVKWSAIQLQKFRDKRFEIDGSVDITKDLMETDSEIRGASPFHVTGTGSVARGRVTFDLHVEGTLVLPCARTLVDVHYPVDLKSTETFLLEPSDYEGAEDEEVHVAENEVIDLIPVMKELILLDIPMQVFSEEAKKGELPHTDNWQVLTEDEYLEMEQKAEKAVDPRMAGLAKFFDQDSE